MTSSPFAGGGFAARLTTARNHPIAAALVVAITLAAGDAIASTEPSQAHHDDDPSKGYDYCYPLETGGTRCVGNGPTRAQQCMDAFISMSSPQHSSGIAIAYDRKREGQMRGRSAVRVRMQRAEVFAEYDRNGNYQCTDKKEFYSGVTTWVVMENDRGQMRRASNVATVASNTSRGFDRDVILRLTRRYTCEQGPGKRKWAIRTRSMGASPETGDRRQFYLDLDSSEYSDRPVFRNGALVPNRRAEIC